MKQKTVTLPLLAVLAAATLTACGERRDETAARTDETTVAARADQAGRDASADANRAANNAGESMREAGRDVKDATVAAANTAGDKVQDAVITTSVNAELAKDKSLSATQINVDTSGGRVALRGTAPDQASRDRATLLASSVKGVVSVDNQLTVDASKS